MSHLEAFAAYLTEHEVAFRRGAPLSEECTFRIGGPADLIAYPGSRGELALAVCRARQEGLPLLILGRGSNMLFDDEGFRGVIIRLGRPFSRIEEEEEGILSCESGLMLSALCEHALQRGLTGLEFAYGIPGTVGGAIYMNAGAYGGEMKDVLLSAEHLEQSGSFGSLMGEAMELSYRHSAYSGGDRVITGGRLRLQPGDPSEIRARMDDYMNRRRTKQPLEHPSAGSTFRRPEGNYASALIDQCGLKGRRVGGAVVSEKHAGFVVNDGGATAADVKELIRIIQEEVADKTGYHLDCEIRIIPAVL